MIHIKGGEKSVKKQTKVCPLYSSVQVIAGINGCRNDSRNFAGHCFWCGQRLFGAENRIEPGASEVFTHGFFSSPCCRAFRATKPAPIITKGLEVLVQEVIAAMATAPSEISNFSSPTCIQTAFIPFSFFSSISVLGGIGAGGSTGSRLPQTSVIFVQVILRCIFFQNPSHQINEFALKIL